MGDLSSSSDLPSQTEAPVESVPPAGRWAGRRLADAVNEVFQLALYRGDIRTAAELLSVMEHVFERAQARLRHENRHADPLIELARRELQTRIAARRRQAG
jgi:hypothetical protein